MGIPVAWNQLSSAYPDYKNIPLSSEVKRSIGGEATQPWLGLNACAIRLSRALNYVNLPLPRNHHGLTTFLGGDGKRYAFRVSELRPYLTFKYGKPDFDIVKKGNSSFDKGKLSGIKGIIAFDIRFAPDPGTNNVPSGHFDLWDGTTFTHEYASGDYWQRATRISVWRTL